MAPQDTLTMDTIVALCKRLAPDLRAHGGTPIVGDAMYGGMSASAGDLRLIEPRADEVARADERHVDQHRVAAQEAALRLALRPVEHASQRLLAPPPSSPAL